MAGRVPVSIFLDEASICAFLDLALHLVHLVLWGEVWMPSHHRPFKFRFEFEVHVDHFFAKPGRGQRSKKKTSWYFWMSLLRRRSGFMLSSFSTKSS